MTDAEQKIIFSRNLNHFLADLDLSQREVAHSIGVSPQTFNTWCKGIAIPRMGKIQKLADFFHVDKSALIDPPSVSSTSSNQLTASEHALLYGFRQLNDDGQAKVCEYTDDLVSSGRYDRPSPDNAGESAGSDAGIEETA